MLTPFRIVQTQFLYQFIIRKKKGIHIREEEYPVIDFLRFPTCKALVSVIETTGLQGIQKSSRSPKPGAPFLRLLFAAAARSYFWKITFWSDSDMPSPLSRTFRMV